MLRSIGAVILGVIVAGLSVAFLETLGHRIFPPPPEASSSDPEVLAKVLAELPIGALLLVLVSWFLGTLIGAWVAARLVSDSRAAHGLVVGGVMMIGGVVTMLQVPHPQWFMVLGALVFLPAAYIGSRLTVI